MKTNIKQVNLYATKCFQSAKRLQNFILSKQMLQKVKHQDIDNNQHLHQCLLLYQ